MKKLYQKPMARKIHFNFEKVVAQSTSTCGSGIVLINEPGTECYKNTPQDASPFMTASIDLDLEACGWQNFPTK